MWGGRTSVGGSALLAIVAIFLIPTSVAEEDFGFDLDFGDILELDLNPNFEVDINIDEILAGGISNVSHETNRTAELVEEKYVIMENLPTLLPDSKTTDEEIDRYHGANFSFELPLGWKSNASGNRDEGNITLVGGCALVFIGWFEDPGADPDDVLGQAVRAYRTGSLRFPVMTAEPGEAVVVGSQRASSLNVYYRYGTQESQKRIVGWSSPVSGRFFYASFWSCPDSWDENLETFEALLAGFQDEISENYVVLDPRPVTLDVWGTMLQETLLSYHFASFAAQRSPEVKVTVTMKSHQEGGKVDQIASEEFVSQINGSKDLSEERALQDLLREKGYSSLTLQRGRSFWVVVLGPEGKWQAISPADPGTERGVGTLVGPDEDGWYRGMVVDGLAEERPSSSQDILEKDCEPPRQVRLKPRTEVNLTWIMGLRNLLDLYSYTQEVPDPGSFHRAQVCWALLEREGYDAWLLTGYVGHPLYPQMWVAVSHPGDEGYVAVKTTAARDHRGLGEIASGDEYFDGFAYDTSLQYSCLHPDRGLMLDLGSVTTPASG